MINRINLLNYKKTDFIPEIQESLLNLFNSHKILFRHFTYNNICEYKTEYMTFFIESTDYDEMEIYMSGDLLILSLTSNEYISSYKFENTDKLSQFLIKIALEIE